MTGSRSIIPPAIVTCIGEDREPTALELFETKLRIESEIAPRVPSAIAARIALAALAGNRRRDLLSAAV